MQPAPDAARCGAAQQGAPGNVHDKYITLFSVFFRFCLSRHSAAPVVIVMP